MTITNQESGTNVHEIADGIFRISTPVPPSAMPGGFTFNQFLVVDEAPLLFHTGLRRMFPLVREGVHHILGDVTRLRYVGFSHVEADESGSLNEWLTVAPRAEAVCSQVAVMVQMNDLADRPPRALADGQVLSLGQRRMCGGWTRRTCRTTGSADGRAQPTDSEILDLLAAEPEPDRTDFKAVRRCMRGLDLRTRTVLYLSFAREKSADEIAHVLETTSGNVRVLRHRAVAQLRGCVDRDKEVVR